MPSLIRWLSGARDMLVCVTDIAVFKAATVYYQRELPYRDQLAKLIDRYADRDPKLTPLLLEAAAEGSDEALWQLRVEHPLLEIDRDNGTLRVRRLKG